MDTFGPYPSPSSKISESYIERTVMAFYFQNGNSYYLDRYSINVNFWSFSAWLTFEQTTLFPSLKVTKDFSGIYSLAVGKILR